MTAAKLQPFNTVSNSDDELWARIASNTPRPPIGKHVLIAGVFGLDNQLLKQLAELQGSTTILTSVGEEALQAAIKYRPDLIIVDVMGSREFELGRILKGDVRTREIPLIGFSAQDEHLVVAAGYDEFVAKPIGIRNFGLLNFLKLLDKLLLPAKPIGIRNFGLLNFLKLLDKLLLP